MSTFNAYAAYYDLLYHGKNYKGEAAYVTQLIRKHFPDANTILDLGCGTGKHDLHFIANGFRITGVDMAPNMIAEANRLLVNEIRQNKATFQVHDIRTFRSNQKLDVV
ncbi:MAG TPA: class I SAM-dependent methyltransferase, partial [Flavitalea sp.]|nr:class I SAM-dependent methyltransferase [Flavitalea sp.]